MEKLDVLVTVPLEPAHLEMIAAVDSRVKVSYAIEELRAERALPATAMIPPYRPPQRAPTAREASAALDRMLADTEVILAWRLPLNILSRAPRLRWIQGIGAGIDILVRGTDLLQSDVIITSSRGVRSTFMAEFVLFQMLAMARQASRLTANQLARRWEPFVGLQLRGKTLGIVGLGSIGAEIARRAKALDMRVVASRRSATSRQKNTDGVDELFPAGELLQMLPQCDFVVLTPPLTAETAGLIGEAELKAMKPAAYLINVSRGPVVKENILIQALKEGWLAGAALDVFETEPLPLDSELWKLPNVLVSPHMAGATGEEHITPLTELFCENLRRFLAGKELLNVIDKKRGY